MSPRSKGVHYKPAKGVYSIMGCHGNKEPQL